MLKGHPKLHFTIPDAKLNAGKYRAKVKLGDDRVAEDEFEIRKTRGAVMRDTEHPGATHRTPRSSRSDSVSRIAFSGLRRDLERDGLELVAATTLASALRALCPGPERPTNCSNTRSARAGIRSHSARRTATRSGRRSPCAKA